MEGENDLGKLKLGVEIKYIMLYMYKNALMKPIVLYNKYILILNISKAAVIKQMTQPKSCFKVKKKVDSEQSC